MNGIKTTPILERLSLYLLSQNIIYNMLIQKEQESYSTCQRHTDQ